jgi:hypothetical protein
MGWTNDQIDTLNVPSNAGPADPQIVIGDKLPTELVDRYGEQINGAVVWRINADRYAYSAIVNLPVGPYRVDGIVNKLRPAGDQVCEVFSYVLDTTGTGVVHIGGFGGGGPQPTVVVDRSTEFNAAVKLWDALDVAGGIGVGGGISGALWDIDVNGQFTGDAVSVNLAAVGGRPAMTGPTGAPVRKMHWGSVTVTTDASGIGTITHGAGFTPAMALVCQNGVSGSGGVWVLAINGSYTSTTFQIKALNGGGVFTGNIGVSYICVA